MYLPSITQAITALGPIETIASSLQAKDTDDLVAKLKHPQMALNLGAEKSLSYITDAAITAIYLDNYFETSNWEFAEKAEHHWKTLLSSLPADLCEKIALLGASAFSYFYHEKIVRARINQREVFSYFEVVEHLFLRGADAPIYVTLLEIDGIKGKGTMAGFRIWQALRDMRNDLVDQYHDKNSIGANIFLFSVVKKPEWQRFLATELITEASKFRPYMPPLLFRHCEETYEEIQTELAKEGI